MDSMISGRLDAITGEDDALPDGMTIRHATMADLDALDAIESACFPPAEAASHESLRARLASYPEGFWLLTRATDCGERNGGDSDGDDGIDGDAPDADVSDTVADGRSIVAFINGFATDRPDLTDDMYDDVTQHDPHGAWQMIFGVDTAPAYRHRGFASLVMRRVIADSRATGRKGLVLTCKDRLIDFYARFGFKDEGVSASTHGHVVWHQMRLTLGK